MPFIITKLYLKNNDVEVIGHYNDHKSASAKIYHLNDKDHVSYRDNSLRFFKVYQKGFFYEYPVYIYKIIELPEVED